MATINRKVLNDIINIDLDLVPIDLSNLYKDIFEPLVNLDKVLYERPINYDNYKDLLIENNEFVEIDLNED